MKGDIIKTIGHSLKKLSKTVRSFIEKNTLYAIMFMENIKMKQYKKLLFIQKIRI